MKCPKCGYNSFDHLEDCKKCGQDLAEHKASFSLRGFFFPGQAAASIEQESASAENSADDGLGFDFLDEDEPAPEETSQEAPPQSSETALEQDNINVSIDQPFGADAESLPADDFSLEDFDEQ
ncbi:MAG: hypothetical protein OET90_01915 [Desulfuromonadales bacterium]|nr:hypothetical protein [Desulfuromonadales bacterium]